MANAWIEHIKKFREKNPNMKYKDVLVKAKETYKGGSILRGVSTPLKNRIGGSAVGGAFSPKERSSLIKKFNKAKKSVEDGLKKGDLKQKDFNDFIGIAKKLSGDSKTNRYSKEVKKLERTFKSKKYAKLVEKNAKNDVRKLKKGQKVKVQERKIDRDLIIQRELSTNIQKANKLEDVKALWDTNGFSTAEFNTLVSQFQGNISEIKRAVQVKIDSKKAADSSVKGADVVQDFKGALSKLSSKILTYENFVRLLVANSDLSYRQAQGVIKKNDLWNSYNTSDQTAPQSTSKTIKGKSKVVSVRKIGQSEPIEAPKQAQPFVNEVGARNTSTQNLIQLFSNKFGSSNSEIQANVVTFRELFNNRSKINEALNLLNKVEDLPNGILNSVEDKRLKLVKDVLYKVISEDEDEGHIVIHTNENKRITGLSVPKKKANKIKVIQTDSNGNIVKEFEQNDGTKDFIKLNRIIRALEGTSSINGEPIQNSEEIFALKQVIKKHANDLSNNKLSINDVKRDIIDMKSTGYVSYLDDQNSEKTIKLNQQGQQYLQEVLKGLFDKDPRDPTTLNSQQVEIFNEDNNALLDQLQQDAAAQLANQSSDSGVGSLSGSTPEDQYGALLVLDTIINENPAGMGGATKKKLEDVLNQALKGELSSIQKNFLLKTLEYYYAMDATEVSQIINEAENAKNSLVKNKVTDATVDQNDDGTLAIEYTKQEEANEGDNINLNVDPISESDADNQQTTYDYVEDPNSDIFSLTKKQADEFDKLESKLENGEDLSPQEEERFDRLNDFIDGKERNFLLPLQTTGQFALDENSASNDYSDSDVSIDLDSDSDDEPKSKPSSPQLNLQIESESDEEPQLSVAQQKIADAFAEESSGDFSDTYNSIRKGGFDYEIINENGKIVKSSFNNFISGTPFSNEEKEQLRKAWNTRANELVKRNKPFSHLLFNSINDISSSDADDEDEDDLLAPSIHSVINEAKRNPSKLGVSSENVDKYHKLVAKGVSDYLKEFDETAVGLCVLKTYLKFYTPKNDKGNVPADTMRALTQKQKDPIGKANVQKRLQPTLDNLRIFNNPNGFGKEVNYNFPTPMDDLVKYCNNEYFFGKEGKERMYALFSPTNFPDFKKEFKEEPIDVIEKIERLFISTIKSKQGRSKDNLEKFKERIVNQMKRAPVYQNELNVVRQDVAKSLGLSPDQAEELSKEDVGGSLMGGSIVGAIYKRIKNIRGAVGTSAKVIQAVKGRNDKHQNKVDSEDNKYLKASSDVYEDLSKRNSIGKYQLIPNMSDEETSVYIDKNNKKLIVALRGTSNTNDVKGTWGKIAVSNLPKSKRFQADLDKVMFVRKQLGSEYKITFTGHSLGGSLAVQMVKKFPSENAVIFNAGYGLGQNVKNLNVKSYSVVGDAVSGLGAGGYKQNILLDSGKNNAISAHTLDAIKDSNGVEGGSLVNFMDTPAAQNKDGIMGGGALNVEKIRTNIFDLSQEIDSLPNLQPVDYNRVKSGVKKLYNTVERQVVIYDKVNNDKNLIKQVLKLGEKLNYVFKHLETIKNYQNIQKSPKISYRKGYGVRDASGRIEDSSHLESGGSVYDVWKNGKNMSNHLHSNYQSVQNYRALPKSEEAKKRESSWLYKLYKWGSKKLMNKLQGGVFMNLDNQDHREIKNITGQWANQLKIPFV